MSDIVNIEALKATVNNMADRADELLSMQGESAHPDLATELFALGRDIQELSYELASAETALRILSEMSYRLVKRASACAEVFGTSAPDVDDFSVTTRIGTQFFGKRFSAAGCHDEDVPF